MVIQRRKFFSVVLGGFAAVFAAGKLSWEQQKPGTAKLTALYHSITKGRQGKYPRVLMIPRKLYDQYQSELQSCQRFVPFDGPPLEESLFFKCTRVVPADTFGDGEYAYGGNSLRNGLA